ncbi:MAG: MDR family MFS transporter [Ktedonobacteraceae bacterium]
MANATPTPAQQPQTPQGNGRRIHGFALGSVLAALMLTLLLEALDQTIVGTALPKIVGELQGFDRYTWVVTAYLLASTTMIPIIGKLSDQFGRKWFFVAGVIIFLLGSALSGVAQTMDQLIAFRAIQGLGAGTGIALVFTVVGDIFPPAERARWQGIFAAVYGFSSVVGPTIGGWLTDHGPLLGNLVTDATRWRWVFYINLPLGIIALVVLLIYLPTNISMRSNEFTGLTAARRIDFLGAFLASSATICLLLGLTWGGNQTYDWTSPQVIIVLVAAAILYVAFFIAERFAREPILPLDLFRNQVFAADSLLALSTGMVLLSLVIYLPLFLQGVLGESATNSGEVITPLTISLVVGSAISGIIIGKFQRYQLITILGSLVLTVGVFLMTLWTSSTSLLTATTNMVVAGVGLGIFFSVVTLAVQNALPRTRMGTGTGAITYLRALGQTLGVAIVGTVVNNTIATDLANRLPASAVKQLTPAGLKFATNTQVLINPTYRDTVVHTAEGFAVRNAVAQATANVPPGPNHDQTVAAIAQKVTAQTIQQTQHLLNQVFDALRLSLAVAIQHSFVAVLFFCGAVIIASIFLKDVPLAKNFREETSATTGDTNEVDTSAPIA